MTGAVMGACIAALASILCQLMINRRVMREDERARARQTELLVYRIDQLEQTVRRLSALVERTALLEQRVKTMVQTIHEMKKEAEYGIQ